MYLGVIDERKKATEFQSVDGRVEHASGVDNKDIWLEIVLRVVENVINVDREVIGLVIALREQEGAYQFAVIVEREDILLECVREKEVHVVIVE